MKPHFFALPVLLSRLASGIWVAPPTTFLAFFLIAEKYA
jgi:hypothetical protein